MKLCIYYSLRTGASPSFFSEKWKDLGCWANCVERTQMTHNCCEMEEMKTEDLSKVFTLDGKTHVVTTTIRLLFEAANLWYCLT